MTSLLGPYIGDTYATVIKDANHNIRHRHCRNLLRSKQNSYKHKCQKILKKKLKKYKLRQDGKEDQDIIDVSDSLLTSLLIRSPNKVKDSAEFELENIRPKNYLFRMVRRKQTSLTTRKNDRGSDIGHKTCSENEASQTSPTTEAKRQTDAFKLLMDSRNKSIGTNSPGKEKPFEQPETQEIVEKKSIKAKRNLILQRMAEEKGCLKKKEREEHHEHHIKRKMEKRAEKLKIMIMNKEPKTVKCEKQNSNLTSQKVRSPLDSIGTETNVKVIDKPKQTLQLVSIFCDSIDKKKTPEKRLIPQEDEEFLNKLSPSLRKKESMLCYFKKVDKDSDSTPADAENDNVIKVKLGPKHKKRGRKKKLSLNKDKGNMCDVSEIEYVNHDTEAKNKETIVKQEENIYLPKKSEKMSSDISNKERRKRKREAKESTPCSDAPLSTYISNASDDKRPRRTVKRPVKYVDEVALSSSDEELHIFTPKKKRHSEHINNPKCKSTIDLTKTETDEEKTKEVSKAVKDKSEKKPNKEKKLINPLKPVKLAPIFKKSLPDPAEIEAKQRFLQSGVPEQLKKLITKQKEHYFISNSFPEVVHVQQLDITLSPPPELNVSEEVCLEELSLIKTKENITKMLNLSKLHNGISMHLKNNGSTQTILQNIKDTYPKFPVHRTYKLLRSKKKGEFKTTNNIFSTLDDSVEFLNCSIDMQNDNPDQLTWCDKYKPLSGNEIIGNFESIKELKKWLVAWSENDRKTKATKSNDSDSSDYYQSEPDSRDSMNSNNNLLILSGPVGSGKTSSVYAVATELSMKVIEVNASSKRNGKIMLQDLQEATQSHKVNRGTGSAENSQKSQDVYETPPEIKTKKRGRPKKVVEPATPKKSVTKQKLEISNSQPVCQEGTRTAMSVILIDDADIIFDQDDGFCSAIVQLVQSSKRPVILITGSLSCPHLQRFLQSSKILKMKPLLPNILGTWLDLMCLADSGTCWPGLGGKFLNYFEGDMRKTINCLQFYLGSQEQVLNINGSSQTDSQNSDVMKLCTDDEISCMSWGDSYDDKNTNSIHNTDTDSVWETFMNEHVHIKHMKYPFRIFNVWWSVPEILNTKSNSEIQLENVEQQNKNKVTLESISNVLDTISVCDFFSCIQPDTEANMTSHPWYNAECNSVSELENFDYYERKHETNNELFHELMKVSITTAQEKLGLENRFIIAFPGMAEKRQRERIISRHNSLTSYLSPQSSLDRKAVALDYWSSCRNICRIEKSKTDSNSKRNNRFCHYLKSLSVLCKSDSFDSLANSLKPSENS